MFGLPADFAAAGVQPPEIAPHRLERHAAVQIPTIYRPAGGAARWPNRSCPKWLRTFATDGDGFPFRLGQSHRKALRSTNAKTRQYRNGGTDHLKVKEHRPGQKRLRRFSRGR